MAREAKEKFIGNQKYQVMPLGSTKGLSALTRLSKSFGPALSAAMSGGFEKAIVAFVQNLTEEDVKFISDTFAPMTNVYLSDGTNRRLSDIFEVQFECAYENWVLWVAFCLEVNYGNFLGEMQKLAGDMLGTKKESPSDSASTSSGQSGGS